VDIKQVTGQNRGGIMLYALSTCVWCKKTKAFLNDLGVEYRYLDVDLVPAGEKEAVLAEMGRWNPSRNFPTIVINNRTAVVGFQPERIKEALGL
jgi:glutaredoxin-like protein NrdH